VTDVGTADPEDDVFRDVSGVVGDALEVASDEKRIESLSGVLRLLVHRFDEHDESLVSHAVNHVVHFEDGLGEFRFAVDERFEGAAHHGAHRGGHAADVDWKINGRQADHVHDALGDVDGLIADAFEIGVDLGDSEDEAEIAGHRRLHGEKVEGKLVNLALAGIDERFAFEHHLAAGEIAIKVSAASTFDGLLRETTHAEQLLAEFIETLLKAGTHYPNLPVM
jgi:hypothetical protein